MPKIDAMHYHAPSSVIARIPQSYGQTSDAARGYYRVASDGPPQPPNTVEDVAKRHILIDGYDCHVVRTWVPDPDAPNLEQTKGPANA
jgi:hypothetical protein